MAVKRKPGNVIRGYTITNWLNTGASAISYSAEKNGRKFFLKQYKAPAPAADWFDSYIAYATEIKKRIQADDAARTRCYEMIEFFVEKDFFQVFEFVDNGMSLTQVLEKRGEFEWDQLVIFAKVLINAIDALHKVGVIHTDLKPDNVFLIADPTIVVGYRLRLIDLDFAILHDRVPPWVAGQHMGYMGTDGYRSPEHLRAQAPLASSDVFTTGIMLGQLLCGFHPLGDTIEEIEKHSIEGRSRPLQLPKPIKKVEDPAFLAGVMNSMLCPDPAGRPSAAQVATALLGRTFDWQPWVPQAFKPSSPQENKPSAAPTPASTINSKAPGRPGIKILFDGAEILSVRVDTALGKNHFKKVHEDARFLSNPQFHLHRCADGWNILHNPDAINTTMVDGQPLRDLLPVRDGMVVAVGNPEKGIIKLPLTLNLFS